MSTLLTFPLFSFPRGLTPTFDHHNQRHLSGNQWILEMEGTRKGGRCISEERDGEGSDWTGQPEFETSAERRAIRGLNTEKLQSSWPCLPRIWINPRGKIREDFLEFRNKRERERDEVSKLVDPQPQFPPSPGSPNIALIPSFPPAFNSNHITRGNFYGQLSRAASAIEGEGRNAWKFSRECNTRSFLPAC